MASKIIKTPPSQPELPQLPELPTPPWLLALGEPTAQRVVRWGREQSAQCLADVFGYHAVQAGWSGYDALRSNRMPQRWLAQQEFDAEPLPTPALSFDSRAWPWAEQSLDLVVLPHTLERSADPQACLREVERVLIAEGQVCIVGINPWSLWGQRLLRQQREGQRIQSGATDLTQTNNSALGLGTWPVQPIAPSRLRDWLHLLGFEVQRLRYAGWTPTWRSEAWVQRWAWLDTLGRRWAPALGGVYLMVATKRVPGGHVLAASQWRKRPARTALAAPAASQHSPAKPAHIAHDHP